MTLPFFRGRRGHAVLLAVAAAVAAPAWAADGNEAAFLAENNAAMDRMMAGMETKPTGDIDQDFTAMMIPHHQGAIDMAQAELRYGKNEQLRRIAQEIIVEQQQEIAAMRLALGQPLPPSAPAPTQPDAAPASRPQQPAPDAQPSMSMDMSHHHHDQRSPEPIKP
ncbi:DUF305 domain-containing protein [Bordetella genomosp. 11]|uniref:DUF305 domain-containing protein n=1 Tax=Bordetella genomosp. 11 TaxID=1416808 RepID=A0A261UWT8_9BORD|nr:DUF305 domain-containing protein [Bordetella genomosp. 11]OZI66366.1 DUF305 domain-containing protein [Bordetella genomosp. 11]